jgi:hypothetical protein
MQRRRLVWLAFTMLMAAGCSHRVYFTQPIRERFELGLHEAETEGEGDFGKDRTGYSPEQLQYFTSERIVLEREATSRQDALTHGRILQRGGRYIERVIVRRGTPGVAVDWGPDWVDVSFESGTRLRFQLAEDARANAPGDERTVATFAGEGVPSTSYRLQTVPDPVDTTAKVDFDGRLYEQAGATSQARLQVKRHAWTQSHRTRRVLRGRRVK